MKNSETLYRIGLFGRSNAGKTSLLVALSETKEATVNDQSWTITYLPPVKGTIADAGLYDKLKRGERLLRQAKESIQKTHKPPPTDESENTTLYRFQLASGGSVRTVELCDYAGEILTPNRLDSVESHGHALAKRIAECDAVLVLAPASDSTDESKTDAERSEQVAKSLARLHTFIQKNNQLNVIQRKPFGLLVTKSDRGDLSVANEIKTFGATAELVWNNVQALIGPSFTRWFSLTTLATKSKPTGLLAPLVWAMNTADSEVVDVSKQANHPSMLAWLRSLGPLGTVGTAKKVALAQVTNLVNRRPAMTDTVDPIHKDARGIQKSLRRSLIAYRVTIALVAGFLVWFGPSSVDAIRTSSFRRVAEDPASNQTELIEAEEYFAGYDARPLWFSFLRIGSDQAVELRDQCRTQTAELQWKQVLAEVDPVVKGELAESYSGTEHANEAIELTQAGKTEKARRAYAGWFDPLQSQTQQNKMTMEQRSELISSLGDLPREIIESESQALQRSDLLTKLRKDQDDEQMRAERQVFIEQLDNLVQLQRPFEALGAVGVRPESLEWSEMKPTLDLLRDNWAGDIESRLSKFRLNEQYETAIQTLQKAIRDRKLIFDSAELPTEPNFEDLLRGVRLDWDKADYANFKAHPSLTTAGQYLAAAHRKCMSQTVNRWVKWKENEDSGRSLRPHLDAITWDKDYGAWHPLVDFFVQGKQVLNKTNAGDGDYGDTYTFPESDFSLEILPKESVECRIVLWDDDWPSADDRVGEFKGTFRFSDLTSPNGATGSLSTDDKKATHQFRIRLLGMPDAPKLLEWQSCE